jgi:hypothetical protein
VSRAEIARLVAQIDASDREIRNLNATDLALGHIRHILAGAAPVIATLFQERRAHIIDERCNAWVPEE